MNDVELQKRFVAVKEVAISAGARDLPEAIIGLGYSQRKVKKMGCLPFAL